MSVHSALNDHHETFLECESLAWHRDFRAHGQATIRTWIYSDGEVSDAEIIEESVPPHIEFGKCLVQRAKTLHLEDVVGFAERIGDSPEAQSDGEAVSTGSTSIKSPHPDKRLKDNMQPQVSVSAEESAPSETQYGFSETASYVATYTLKPGKRPPVTEGWHRGYSNAGPKIRPNAGYPRPASDRAIAERNVHQLNAARKQARRAASSPPRSFARTPGAFAIGIGAAGLFWGATNILIGISGSDRKTTGIGVALAGGGLLFTTGGLIALAAYKSRIKRKSHIKRNRLARTNAFE